MSSLPIIKMPLSLSPARVFAELVPPPVGTNGTENDSPGLAKRIPGFLQSPGREVHVSGTAELSAGPDRATVTVHLRSKKAEAHAAQNSVARRLDYIAQIARQRGGVSEENVTITKNFSRIDNAYKMEAELIREKTGDRKLKINLPPQALGRNNPQMKMPFFLRAEGPLLICITFSDFGKMQDVCNFLVEKLDSSVIINPPHFYHTVETIDNLRRQVCLAAVGSAQQKAQEVCRLFGQLLGKPLLIREEEMKEWEGHLEKHVTAPSDSMSLQQSLQSATIYVSSKMFAVFEIKGEKKRKQAALLNIN